MKTLFAGALVAVLLVSTTANAQPQGPYKEGYDPVWRGHSFYEYTMSWLTH